MNITILLLHRSTRTAQTSAEECITFQHWTSMQLPTETHGKKQSTLYDIWYESYDAWFALENWQASRPFNL